MSPQRSASFFRDAALLLAILPMYFLLFFSNRNLAGIAGAALLSMILLTVGGVLLAAVSPRATGMGWAILSIAGTALFVGFLAKDIGLIAAFSMGVLASTWLGLWMAAAWTLRRLGPGFGVGVALSLASICMALPVAAMPLVRAAGRWGPPGNFSWQNGLVQIIAHACPFFPALGALRPAVTIDWGTLPGMYAWSGLGQEIPLPLPNVWFCSTLYAGSAVILCLLGWLLRSTPPAPIPPR